MTEVPTLYEWIGGAPALARLTTTFYGRVPEDPILAPVFARMSADHPQHVAEFLGEVFGGPKVYSEARGGHAEMIRHHLSRSLSHEQRRRWIALLLNSQPGAEVVEDAPMPRWGWGETGGPYSG